MGAHQLWWKWHHHQQWCICEKLPGQPTGENKHLRVSPNLWFGCQVFWQPEVFRKLKKTFLGIKNLASEKTVSYVNTQKPEMIPKNRNTEHKTSTVGTVERRTAWVWLPAWLPQCPSAPRQAPGSSPTKGWGSTSSRMLDAQCPRHTINAQETTTGMGVGGVEGAKQLCL